MGGGGGLLSPLPVRGEVRGEEIIVGEIHSVEILITLKLLCVFSSLGKKVINPLIRISTSLISHEIRPDERNKYLSCLLIMMEAMLSFD